MEPHSESKTFVTHDFSALNNHVDEVYWRTRQVTHHRRLDVFKRFALYSFIILTGFGVLALILALAYWLAFAPPKPDTRFVEKPVFVDKPVIVEKEVIIERPIDSKLSIPKDLLARLEKIEQTGAGKGKNEAKIIQNFTLFTTVELELDGIASVVTGANFDNSRSIYPSRQYCYVDIPDISSDDYILAPRKNIDLAKKNGKEDAVYFPLNGKIATSSGTTLSALKKAQKMCKFM